mmetsp:Transcript_19348/g.48399  ORF Transcript_19348/g.48399 Transcript_19348/m.48399 type:complete len:230 (-) Transcript_19348:583-1272(-)
MQAENISWAVVPAGKQLVFCAFSLRAAYRASSTTSFRGTANGSPATMLRIVFLMDRMLRSAAGTASVAAVMFTPAGSCAARTSISCVIDLLRLAADLFVMGSTLIIWSGLATPTNIATPSTNIKSQWSSCVIWPSGTPLTLIAGTRGLVCPVVFPCMLAGSGPQIWSARRRSSAVAGLLISPPLLMSRVIPLTLGYPARRINSRAALACLTSRTAKCCSRSAAVPAVER